MDMASPSSTTANMASKYFQPYFRCKNTVTNLSIAPRRVMSCVFRFYEPLPSQTQIAILERIRFHLPFILIVVLSLKVMWPKSPMPSIHHCPVSHHFCQATETFSLTTFPTTVVCCAPKNFLTNVSPLARSSPFTLEGADNVMLETIKRGEDDQLSGDKTKTIILRVYEHLGGHAKVKLNV